MHRAGWLLTAAIGLSMAPAQAIDRLRVQVPAALDPGPGIPDFVRRDCNVGVLIGNHVLHKVKESIPQAEALEDPMAGGPAPVLALRVQDVHPGEGFSHKSITLRADLIADGQRVQTKIFNRKSTQDPTGMGPCAFTERIARSLAVDISIWLRMASHSIPQKE